jgi:CHRD domain
MKKIWMLPIFSLAFTSTQIITSASAIAATLFQANIDVGQEVCSKPAEPCPSTSNATGFFSAELNDAEDALKYTFKIDGLDLGSPIGKPQTADSGDDIVKVHIHFGARGVAGPVVFAPLDLTMGERDNDLAIVAPEGIIGGTLSGIWTLSEGLQDQLDNLKSGQLYVNIHSSRFLANGELRGQITKAPEPTMLLGLVLVGTTGLLFCQRQRN